MSDFVESAKNFMSAAVSRTSWEAQKRLRLSRKQSEIDKLMEQRQQLTNQIVQITLDMYTQGTLTDAQMSRLCASIVELDHDVRSHDAQLQEIKKEAYPNEQFTPGPTTNYTPPPVSPVQPFQQGPTAPPPPKQGPAPQGSGGGTQAQICPHCGNPLRSGALYCRNCGEKVR
jgi:hypothetical protein